VNEKNDSGGGVNYYYCLSQLSAVLLGAGSVRKFGILLDYSRTEELTASSETQGN
jgi:hypothetical protein